MDPLIQTIHAAIAPDASDEAKHQGALACRTILATLEPRPAQPPTPVASAAQITALVGALRGMPLDQLLDMAIDRLRKAVLNAGTAPAASPLQFQMVPVASLAPSGGGP